jgi:hypothetical protein
MKMRRTTRYAAVTSMALVIAGGGAATGMAIQAPSTPKIPTSCVAPMNDGTYKKVQDGDAERYESGVYVCTGARWVLDPEYGQ